MKSDAVTGQLKDKLGLTKNDEIIPAIEAALSAKDASPLGATVIISPNGKITFSPFGLSNPPTLQEVEALRRVFRTLDDSLEEQKVRILREEMTAQLAQSNAAEA